MISDNSKSGIDEWRDKGDLRSIQALGDYACFRRDLALDVLNALSAIAKESSRSEIIDMVACRAGESNIGLKKYALDLLGNIKSDFPMMKVRDLCYSDFELIQHGLKISANVPTREAVQNISRLSQDIPGMGIRGISTLIDMQKHFARTAPNIVTLAENAIIQIKKSVCLGCSPV